jgi:hypothetical protein
MVQGTEYDCRVSNIRGCVPYWLNFDSIEQGEIFSSTLPNGPCHMVESKCVDRQTDFGSHTYIYVLVRVDDLLVWVMQSDIRCSPAGLSDIESDDSDYFDRFE